MGKLEEAGILHYDVPDEIRPFAGRLRARLRRGRALPASKSVYIINWADKPALEKMIEKAKESFAEDYPDDAHKVSSFVGDFIKADDVSAEQAHEMAVRGLARLCSEIHSSLAAKLKKMKKAKVGEMPRRVQVSFIHKLKEVECLAVAFRLMEDVEVALEAATKAVMAHLAAEVVAKHLKPEGEPATQSA